MDWIDDYGFLTVDTSFCVWLASYYNVPQPQTNEVVASDSDAGIDLCRWRNSLAVAMTGGDPDAFDGIIGGDSPIELVSSYDTWMTQRQAWQMQSFFRGSLREANVTVELRLQ